MKDFFMVKNEDHSVEKDMILAKFWMELHQKEED